MKEQVAKSALQSQVRRLATWPCTKVMEISALLPDRDAVLCILAATATAAATAKSSLIQVKFLSPPDHTSCKVNE